jgi:hypothetical protein
VGSSIMGAGLALASGSIAVTVLIVVYLAGTITAAVRSEEAFLRRKFGADYDRYRRGDAATSDPAARSRRFSIKQAIANREHRAVSGLLVAVLLLGLKAAYNGTFWRAAGTR